MPQERPLNSDELGKKGESRFGEICADAKLICNGSERDRTGWDFLVELPFVTPTQNDSLDKRTAPLSCHFQIKTIWQQNDRIRVRLSAAERLAKEKKPAFIYVFKVTGNLEFPEAYLIHFIDETLATVLKRLRQEHAKGSKKVNDKYIYFSVSAVGKKIAPTGAGLKAAITDTCGPNITTYIEKKSKQLAEIGFEEPRFHGEMSLHYEDDEALIDAFLGKGKLEVTNFKAIENRFGIPIQQTENGPNTGHLSVDPIPTDKCRTVFRSGTDEPATFDCDVLSTPQVFSEQIGWKILIRNKIFEISISNIKGVRKARLDLKEADSFSEKKHLSELKNYARLLKNLAKGNCSVIITPGKPNISSATVTINEKITPENEAITTNQLKLLSATKRIFDLVGNSDPELNLRDLVNIRSSVFELEAIINGKAEKLKIGVLPYADKEQELRSIAAIETLVVNFLAIGDSVIGYSILTYMTFEEGKNGYELHGDKLRLCDIREFKNVESEFELFVETQKLKANVQGLVVNRPIVEADNDPTSRQSLPPSS